MLAEREDSEVAGAIVIVLVMREQEMSVGLLAFIDDSDSPELLVVDIGNEPSLAAVSPCA